MLPHVAPEVLTAAVEEVAGELLAECGQLGPPVDALRMAEQLTLTVAWDDSQQPRARCVRITPSRGRRQRGAILLRPEPRQGADSGPWPTSWANTLHGASCAVLLA